MSEITGKTEKNSDSKMEYYTSLGIYDKIVKNGLKNIANENLIERIWKKDATVWNGDTAEIANRLGWLDCPESMINVVSDLELFVDKVRAVGFTHAVLLGIGGSSLATEVLSLTFGAKSGYLELSVLDSTHPQAVLEKEQMLDISKTMFVVSTKSGGTIETISFMKYFYNKTLETVGPEKVGRHFVAITDPGSGLESIAKELQFRRIFLNDPNIGGRNSALSYFGLVPAMLLGIDVKEMLNRAATMAEACKNKDAELIENNPGALLGAIMGELANTGRDKLTLITSPEIKFIGAWIEQLIAESTGKEGKGILPVDGEMVAKPYEYQNDRLFVYLRLKGDDTFSEKVRLLKDTENPVIQFDLDDIYDLGGEFFRWEFATAIAGNILDVNPFDQPNVESAKILARNMMAEYQKDGELPALEPDFEEGKIKVYSDIQAQSLGEYLSLFLDQAVKNGGEGKKKSYISLQAFIPPTEESEIALYNIRTKIHKIFKLATSVGFGPRFLHSTGQLHKGDSGNGHFIQITADITKDIPIPEQAKKVTSQISFGTLISAQALGDRQALINEKRNIVRFDLGDDIIGGLVKIFEALA